MTDPTRNSSDPITLLDQASAVFADVLRNVRPEQMALPTVNDEWDVRALINHLVAGNYWAAEVTRKGSGLRASGDVIGDRPPLDAYTASAQEMIAAFREPGALERQVSLPFGEMPAAGFARFRFNDMIAHAWDLAQATGQNRDIAPELSEIAIVNARERLEGRDRAQTPFKDEVPVPADAPAADRLAGYLGKPVS